MKAPFPYFGGKSKIAPLVWQALGDVRHYMEPFFGSGAVLLARLGYRQGEHVETICDADGFICNVWRSLQFAPDEVARWCDWPVNHADLSAKKKALLKNESRLLENLVADERWFDPIIAGYWVWAASCWIGSGLTRPNSIPALGKTGAGVHKLSQVPHLSDAGKGVQEPYNINLYTWFRRLSARLRYVHVVCGDWKRVCGGNWQDNMGTVGLFFDPPYGVQNRDQGIYHKESLTEAGEVKQWCLERGAREGYRIVLAGYNDEHSELLAAGWRIYKYSAGGGYANKAKNGSQGQLNRHREALFISPGCLSLKDSDHTAQQMELMK